MRATFPLYDAILRGRLELILRRYRGAGLSLRDTAAALQEDHNVGVSHTQIARWCSDLGIPPGRPAWSWPEALLGHLRVNGPCVDFTGTDVGNGYKRLKTPDGPQLAHRAMYELMVGPIPDGFHVHHTCVNTACVNPGHLAAVSPSDHGRLHTQERVA